MCKPCLHCENKNSDAELCPQCTCEKSKKEIKILELKIDWLNNSIRRFKRELAIARNPNVALDFHVYCTRCKNFRLDDENIPYCAYSDICNIENCEDSTALSERPMYKDYV